MEGQGYDGLSAESIGRLGVVCPQLLHAEWGSYGAITPDEDGGLMVHGMSELREVCRHQSVDALSARPAIFADRRPMIPLEIDGPLHTTFRRLLNPLFSPSAVAALEPTVREITDSLLDAFVSDGRADVYENFCKFLPAMTFLRFMGLPPEGLTECIEFKDSTVRHRTEESAAETAARKEVALRRFEAYFAAILDERRRADEQPDDLITALLELRIDAELLDDDTIVDVARILIIGGLDTVASALSLDLLWLAQHPDERCLLVAEPSRWKNAVEELLRYETITPLGKRHARDDVEIGDMHIPAGTQVHVSWAGANLDPGVFPDPLTVVLDREPNPHVAFAAGIHHCLGAHLARMELRTALEQFHRRIPNYELDDTVELHFESVPIRLVSPLPLVWA